MLIRAESSITLKINWKPILNHQSEAMFFLKANTLKFVFDRYLEHMVSYQEMQSAFPMFLVGVNLAL